MPEKVVIIRGQEVAVTAAVKNAFMHDPDEDRERKRRKRREKNGVQPEFFSMDAMREVGRDLPSEFNLEETIEKRILHEQLHKAVMELPKANRDVIILRFLQGKKIIETSEALGIPTSTVTSREQAGIQALRKVLEQLV